MSPAAVQESVGFADPGDIQTLLDYRLPDWGCRTWDASFDFHGNGAASHGDGGPCYSGGNTFNLGTDLLWNHEGERWPWWAGGHLRGAYQKNHWSATSQAVGRHDANGAGSAYGGIRHYLADGPFNIGVSGTLQADYSEQANHRVAGTSSQEMDMYRRSRDAHLQLNFGVGRIRDVTPLLRARRLSERLTAMGRPPLTRSQVLRVTLDYVLDRFLY